LSGGLGNPQLGGKKRTFSPVFELSLFLSKIGCDSRGEGPGLFGEFGNCETDGLEDMHKMILRQMTPIAAGAMIIKC
jgi:hypothetical protein